jgi:phosphoribosylanthranilate isomerase
MTVVTPRVKICGLTRLEDAELSASLGAWALGMVFYEPSPRRCSLEEAGRISAALRRRTSLCGVFVNAPLEEIERTSEELGLSLVQLHGDEGPSFCGEVARRTGAHVIKATQISTAADVQDLARFHVDYHLADARAHGLRGGTGETFDWELLAARRSSVPLILSGGLNPDNLAEAIAAVHPFAVDTASGTEAAPGRKDPALLRAFFAAAVPATEPAPADAA